MGAGYNMMNDLTIVQTTQGLCQYMLQVAPECKKKGVVIGYDGRHNSDRFAKRTSTVFVCAGIPVYLFSKMCPTPYVAYGVRHYNAQCGIMVTASHNPKEDNGYKVYWDNGSQIIPPHDKGIAASILSNLEPLATSWDYAVLQDHPLNKDPFQEILDAYNADLKKLVNLSDETSTLKFTYTAMHGVGYPFILEACKAVSHLEVIPVLEQVEADPEFPTVKYPNPEEGKGALELSIKTAEANNCKLILANDPDADRLAIAEQLPNNSWHIFTGNEIGALLGWWCWYNFRQKNKQISPSDVHMLASTVSSKILQTIAKKEGFNFIETLTGFKWMGNKADELMKEGKTVLFAFEEAIGFMCGTNVLDKDGVSAAMVCGQLVTYLKSQGQTLDTKLNEIYKDYGFHLSSNSYYICHEPTKIKAMFDDIRNFNSSGMYPETLGPYKLKYIRDLTTGYDNSTPDKKPILPVSKSSQMITFTFENGCVVTLRTSGTEPKIKYYTEHKPDHSKQIDKSSAEKELSDIVGYIVKMLYQPEKFDFIPKSE